MMSPQNPRPIPPGWYDDGHGALRWWDGQQWTDHVQPHPQGVSDMWQRPRQSPAPEQSGAAGTAEEPSASGPGETGPSESATMGDGDASGTADTASGIFAAATEPAQSRTWIIWVVVGVVMLLLVVLAAIFIPLAILAFGRVDAAPAVTPGNDDERGAVATVYDFDEAWRTADCDLYLSSTTQRLREVTQIKDCATFTMQASGFDEWYSDYEIVVTDIRGPGHEYTVATRESYLAHFDQDGQPLEPGVQQVVEYEYMLVPDDDGWAIYDLVSVE